MQTAKVLIEIIKTPSGKLRIKFEDGGSFLIPDEACNMHLYAAFEVEIELANKASWESKKSGT